MRSFQRLLTLPLAVFLGLGTITPSSWAVSKQKIRSEIYKIKVKDKKRKEHLKKVKALKEKEAQKKKTLIGIQQDKEKAQQKLIAANRQFELAHKKVEDITKSLDKAEERWEDKMGDAKARLRRMYKTRRYSKLNQLAEAKNTTSFIRKMSYYQYLADQDKTVINKLKLEKDNLERLQLQLMKQRQKVTKEAHRQAAAKEHYQKTERKEKVELSKITKERQAHEKAARALERASRRITAELKRLLQGRKNTRHVQLGTGRFTHPVRGYPRTSPFGWRVHPIFRTRRMHTGMDYGAPAGVKIRAADTGVVISAGWRGGYGKAVLIDHGKGVVTLYAHSSAYYVRAGQRVKKGQIIAAVGSTGYSTGPHLHFEVRVGGVPRNPARWL